jgi:hypothetical protein
MSLRADIITHERERRKLSGQQKDELKRRILSLPVNPRAKPLGKNGFVVNFASLGNKWSVEHHNFGSQYLVLADMIDKAETPLSALLRLRRAVRERRIVVGGNTTTLHDDVVTGLKSIMAT